MCLSFLFYIISSQKTKNNMRFRLFVAAISIATICNAADFDEIVDSIYSNNIEVKAIEHRLAGDAAAIRSPIILKPLQSILNTYSGRKQSETNMR